MSGGFAIDTPVTNLDDGDIDDFRIHGEEIDDMNLNDSNHNHELSDFQFNSGNSNIFTKGWKAISNLLPRNNSRFQRLSQFNFNDNEDEYIDDIELMNRNGSIGSDFDFDYFNDKDRKCKFLNKGKGSKIIFGHLIAIIIGLLVTVIVLSVKFSKQTKGVEFSETHNSTTTIEPTTPIIDDVVYQTETPIVKPGSDSELTPKRLTVVIAIDGLNPHYISEANMPKLNNLLSSEKSIYARYLKQVNPANSLSNIWSLSTGMYPGQHGIIDDTFYDPTTDEIFKNYSSDKKWWIGESIWDRVHKAGMKILTFNWMHIISSKEHISYHEIDELKEQAIQLEYYLNGEDINEERYYIPNLLLMKINSLGHIIRQNGKLNGKALVKELNDIDVFIETVYMLIEKYNMIEYANIMIVSEGSYVPVDHSRVIEIGDIIDDLNAFKAITGDSIVGLYPKDDAKVQEIAESIHTRLDDNVLGDHIRVIYDKTELEKVYGGMNEHIAPIIIVPDVGYHVNYGNNELNNGIGNGYMNDESLSHGVFIATGKYFDSIRDGKKVLNPFDMPKVYNLICDTLEINYGNGVQNWDLGNEDIWDDSEICSDDYPDVTFPMDIIDEDSFFRKQCQAKLEPLKPIDNVHEDKGNSNKENESDGEDDDKSDEDDDKSDEDDDKEDKEHDDNDEKEPTKSESWWDRIVNAVDEAEDAIEDTVEDIKSHFHGDDNDKHD